MNEILKHQDKGIAMSTQYKQLEVQNPISIYFDITPNQN